jgi:hypothetical protein
MQTYRAIFRVCLTANDAGADLALRDVTREVTFTCDPDDLTQKLSEQERIVRTRFDTRVGTWFPRTRETTALVLQHVLLVE